MRPCYYNLFLNFLCLTKITTKENKIFGRCEAYAFLIHVRKLSGKVNFGCLKMIAHSRKMYGDLLLDIDRFIL